MSVTIQEIYEAVWQLKKSKAFDLVKNGLAEGLDPVEMLQKGVIAGLRVVGDKLEPHVAVLGRPAGGHAPDQERRERFEPAHPFERLRPLPPQAPPVRLAAEQRVMVGERLLDGVVRGQGRRVGEQQRPRRLALGERPVGDAVLGDEPRRRLRDLHAAALRAQVVAATGFVGRRAAHQNSWSRMSRGGWPAGTRLSSPRPRGGNSA